MLNVRRILEHSRLIQIVIEGYYAAAHKTILFSVMLFIKATLNIIINKLYYKIINFFLLSMIWHLFPVTNLFISGEILFDEVTINTELRLILVNLNLGELLLIINENSCSYLYYVSTNYRKNDAYL